jgi:hypothetical protein
MEFSAKHNAAYTGARSSKIGSRAASFASKTNAVETEPTVVCQRSTRN